MLRFIRMETHESPSGWDAALDFAEFRDKVSADCEGRRLTDMPKPEDFPILYTTRWMDDDMAELTFFSYKDARYLFALKAMKDCLEIEETDHI